MSFKDKEIKKAYNKQYYKDHKDYFQQWRKDNPEKGLMYSRRSHRSPDYFKQYDQTHKSQRNERLRNKRRIDLKFNISNRMSTMIGHALKGNKAGNHWEVLVGYSLIDLIKRLKKTMPRGYTWKDYLDRKLQIDHTIPISVFNYDNVEHIDFKRCWSLDNLQLLPARENLIKSNKLTRPFQPSLKLEVCNAS